MLWRGKFGSAHESCGGDLTGCRFLAQLPVAREAKATDDDGEWQIDESTPVWLGSIARIALARAEVAVRQPSMLADREQC